MALPKFALTLASTVTTSGAVAAGVHTPVDASAGTVTMTLPTPSNAGAYLRVEKVDASGNSVVISGNIRGATSTVTLVGQFQAVDLEWVSGTWRPAHGHLPVAVLSGLFQAKPTSGTPSSSTFLRGDGAWAAPAGTGGGGGTAAANLFPPEAYGAVGDGTTDDTTAVQAAVNAAQTYTLGSSTGLVGVVPLAGLYKVASTVSVTKPVGILGLHQAGTGLIAASGLTGGIVLNVAPAGTVLLDSFSITDPGTSNTLLTVNGAVRSQVSNLLLTGGGDQVQIKGVTDLRLRDNMLRSGVNAFAFRGTTSTHVQLANNRVRDATAVYYLESSGIVTSLSYTGDDIINGVTGSNLTNSRAWLAAAMIATPMSGRMIVDGSTADSAFGFMETNSGTKTYIRRNQFALEWLNNGFTTAIMALDNAGRLTLGDAVQLASSTAPTAAASEAGSVRYKAGAAGVADILQACLKTAADVYQWVNIGTGSGGTGPLSNYTATSNPTITSDSAAGYAVGSSWVNTSTTAMFECVSAAVGAAVWRRVTADVQVFTTPGDFTWTKPAWAQVVEVALVAGGGGGGSGTRWASSTPTSGGAGGGGGGFATGLFDAASCGTTESIRVGTGGTGGTAIAVDSTVGAGGANGSSSFFGSKVRSAGGTAGAGGTTSAASTGGAAGAAMSPGGTGGSGVSGGAGNAGAAGAAGGAGGGAGGGVPATPAVTAGGAGGVSVAMNSAAAAAGATAGAAGAAGTGSTATTATGGGGGAGGASSTTGTGGAGGAGGVYGAGGGGGGSSLNGAASGAGGTGGNGIVVVISR